MSAFMVKADSINRIVTFFQQLENKTKACTRRGVLCYVESPFSFVNANGEVSPTKMKKLARQMFDMNAEAVNCRYGGRHPDMIPETFKHEPIAILAAHAVVQVLKNLHCFLYQCSEGDVDQQDLYQKLEKFAESLSSAVLAETDEYKSEEWE